MEVQKEFVHQTAVLVKGVPACPVIHTHTHTHRNLGALESGAHPLTHSSAMTTQRF